MRAANDFQICHQCDLVLAAALPRADQLSRCSRCGAELNRGSYPSMEAAQAAAVTAGVLWVIMNTFPLVRLTIGGAERQTTVAGAAVALGEHGMPLLAVLVAWTALAAPAAEIGLAILVLTRLDTWRRSGRLGPLVRGFRVVQRWNMVDVFLLGCMVAVVKLAHMAQLVAGPALWACAALVPLLAFLNSTMRPHRVFADVRG